MTPADLQLLGQRIYLAILDLVQDGILNADHEAIPDLPAGFHADLEEASRRFAKVATLNVLQVLAEHNPEAFGQLGTVKQCNGTLLHSVEGGREDVAAMMELANLADRVGPKRLATWIAQLSSGSVKYDS